ncbi:nitroreductase family protein [Carboxylicivirga marina]|uniref:Nitroreductase family protein n=1 Tax=Carboxylicivirga marina TaxID=2800988 RepID=A0ABS1HHJ5_9BACT|nr:nitroreductase family protein [Carboxylicivirga marina]MBK3516748.1 nitroreductase family protein [Carboxylicivirga marina]
MLNFKIDEARCTQCGMCSKECPTLIINGKNGIPEIKEGKEKNCIKCQHCLAICPTAALSIFGKNPDDSLLVEDETPSTEALERLIKTRRSVRRFKKEAIDSAVINQLIETAAYAPTGHNKNQVLLSVTDSKEALAKVRTLVYDTIKKAKQADKLEGALAMYGSFQKVWEEKGIDVIFRDAPHLIIASAPKSNSNGPADCVISLSYFELLANSMGIGTLWNGFLKSVFEEIAPELHNAVGIPEEHAIGYMMVYGIPAVKFTRSVQSEGLNLNKINL